MSQVDSAKGMLLGLAVGDAVGTTLEFKERGTFDPIHDMVGGGPFNLRAGQWTDDTSMALCLANSLLENNHCDMSDQLEKYTKWYLEGYMSGNDNGTCFDIGGTVRASLLNFKNTKDPESGQTDHFSAGNGAIMRIAPVALSYTGDTLIRNAKRTTITTHAHQACIDGSDYFIRLLDRALDGADKDEIFDFPSTYENDEIQAIADGNYMDMAYEDLYGSGYVVHCLQCALWCFRNTDSFEDAILASANLGDDADTTAAVCGQLAGAYYGACGIRPSWLDKLHMKGYIESLAVMLLKRRRQENFYV